MTATPAHEVDLAIGGMTCASCSSRVERKLNRLDGVDASVNLATERAHVRFAEPVRVDDLIATVEKTGYTATLLHRDGGSSAASGTAPGGGAEARSPGPGRHRRGARDTDPYLQTGPTETALPGATTILPATPGTGPAPDDRVGDDGPSDGSSPWDRVRAVFHEPPLRVRAIVAIALAVPVVLVAMVPALGHALGAARPWIELLLSLPVVVWAAFPFHRAAALNARHGASTMDTLVSLGVVAAFGWSLVRTLLGDVGHMYYEVAVVVTAFLLLGRYAESRAKDRGRSSLVALLELGAKESTRLRTDPFGHQVEEVVPVGALAVGDVFLVRPGEKIATDGVVEDGYSAIDRSLVTGESMPVEAGVGDEVTGGTLNTSGRLVVRATRVGSETVLAGITRLVEAAQTGKAPVQRLADRVSAVFVPTVLVLSLVTLVGWLLTGHGGGQALSAAVAVLIIACPCALGLATPTALLVGTGRGAELGVLIKGPEILESTRRVDVVLLDKTGTVTSGRMRLVHLATAGRLTSTAALQSAASVEVGSEHPVARAIVDAARERGLDLKPITDFAAEPGRGAHAAIKGTTVTVGKPDLFERIPAELADARPAVGTTVYVGWGGTARGALTVADEVRPTSLDSLRRLAELGLSIHLVTGDNAATATAVARTLGIDPDHVIADVEPQDKHAVVARLQGRGRVVAMVGDGVNDAAALARADLGLAMGSGTDVAMESADIVLMRPDVGAVADAIGLSRKTLRIIKQNLFWAFGYNVAALPLAAFGLLNPMIAGAAMAASSVLVVTNSLRLRSFARDVDGVAGPRD